MGFWQDFTGATARKQAQRGYDASKGMIDKGYADSKGYLDTGYGDAKNALLSGSADLTAGYTDAAGAVNSGYDTAGSQINALLTGGGYGNAQRMYGNAVGVNGRDAQVAAGQQFEQFDPFRQGNEDRATNALLRAFAGRGIADSGASRLASARASQERGSQDWSAWLDRLAGLGSQGNQLAMSQAQLGVDRGNALAGIHANRGQGLAGQNALLAGYGMTHGGAQAGLATDYANTSAGNRINLGNAKAQAASSGVNNLLGLAGLGLQGWGTWKGLPGAVKT